MATTPTTPNTPNTPTSPTPELRPAQTDRRYYWFLIIYLVLIISMLVFIAGAVISVFSTSMTFFLMCRLIQGMGASGGYFLARTIPADIFHGRELANSRNRFILRTGRNCLGTGLSPDIWSCCATRLS